MFSSMVWFSAMAYPMVLFNFTPRPSQVAMATKFEKNGL